MAITVTSIDKSLGLVGYMYQIDGLVNGSNSISLPTPPATGSFPPDGLWTPTVILCFPYASGSIGSLVTPDYTTITNTNGLIAFSLYAAGATSCLVFVY